MAQTFNLKLVELVRARPQIWDRNDPCYRNYNKHSDVWKQIAAELGVTPKQANQKWNTLRGNYSRHLRTLMAGKKSTSHIAEAMDFLRPHMELRESGQLLKGQPTGDPEPEDNSVNAAAEEEEYVARNGRKSSAFALDTGSKDVMVNSRNADAAFLLSLLPQMQRMSPAEKRTFKQRALELSQEFLDGWRSCLNGT